MYITKEKRDKLLEQNDGFTDYSNFSSRNFNETRRYEIRDGELRISSKTNTSWADSREETEWTADDRETNRFLHKVLDKLDTAGIE